MLLLAANFRPYHPLGERFRGNNHYIRAPIYSCLQDLQIEKGETFFVLLAAITQWLFWRMSVAVFCAHEDFYDDSSGS